MARLGTAADEVRVSFRLFVSLIVGALGLAILAGETSTASAGPRACGVDVAGNGGYSYAGYQATLRAHGVRATITATRSLEVTAGHVAGWVGVGGPGQGAGGEDAWIQAGIATVPGVEPFLYAEVTRGGRYPKFILLENDIEVGESRSVAVLEVAGRPGYWRVWAEGKPATKPFKIRSSSGRWAPIATAESFSGGQKACNSFAFRFERVLVARGGGGAWQPFESAHRFLDRGNTVRALAADRGSRQLQSARNPLPYAFVASS